MTLPEGFILEWKKIPAISTPSSRRTTEYPKSFLHELLFMQAVFTNVVVDTASLAIKIISYSKTSVEYQATWGQGYVGSSHLLIFFGY